ncbi:MAG: hypothetical protein C4530_01710 [Desulfobacteraceae bacterium]|nr:MAG: hypothetical protein C4530_01710 [Desulfobacteraceae bacterium]
MKSKLFALTALLMVMAEPAPAADIVDMALVGTWKLEWQHAGLFWAIRSDGVYRMHGPGAAARQLGKIEAKQGRFSMKAPFWMDSGPYKLSNADTLVITGQLGPGTWKRVWTPTKTGSKEPAGPGACGLLAADEVAQVLRAPVTGGQDPRAGEGGCMFRSQLGSLDRVSIGIRQNTPGFFQNNRRSKGESIVDVSGVGDQAYAELVAGDNLGRLQFLRRDLWVTIEAGLNPQATMDDLPYLVELSRAADRRLGGFSLPGPSDSARKRMEAFEKAKAGGWKGRLPAGKSIPPQKGPKPFKGW